MKKKENDEIRITPDALISLVVTEAEERELASMPSLKEMNAQFHPSEQFQKKMDRLLKKAHRKEGWVQIWKPTKKVLIAFTSVMTALTFALLPVQAFQDAVVDTLIQWRDGFMNIVYSQETDRQHPRRLMCFLLRMATHGTPRRFIRWKCRGLASKQA